MLPAISEIATIGGPFAAPAPEPLGQVFTPPALVDFILDQAGYVAGSSLLGTTLLEPACGDGAFLVAAAGRLADSVRADGETLSSKAGAELLADALSTSLWGVDLDERAVLAARDAMTKLFVARTGRQPPSGFFEQNVVVADFLLGDRFSPSGPMSARRLDFVIGNPPYVSTTALSLTHKAALRERFETASGRIDLYGLFVERSAELLREGGVLSFIVPDKILQSHSARPLRALLLRQGSLRSIACFDSHKVFTDAATVPCVFVFERSRKLAAFNALECEYRNGNVPGRVVIRRQEELPRSRLADPAWRTKGIGLEAMAATIGGAHPRLGDVAARVSAGFATGRDSIFVVHPTVAKTLDPDLLRPVARGRDIGALSLGDSGLSVLVPYTFPKGGGAKLIDIKDFPRTHAYLKQFRGELEKRHCVRTWEKAWFDIHDPVPGDVARVPKVLVPDIAEAPRFVFDDGHRCPLHSAYYVVPKTLDGRMLAALLNSQPIEFLIRLRAPVVKDGFNRYRRQFLIDLPIPNADARTARDLIAAGAERDFQAVDELASKLFGLSAKQVRVIEAHLKQFRYRRVARDRSRDVAS